MNLLRSLLPGVVFAAAIAPTCADKSSALSTAEFDALHALIKPQPGESRWMEIDWHPNVWEGREVAAAQGKPIFFMAGSGGAPCAGC
jgi:hypothetical protein